jgi:hypothetical protein
MLSLLFLLQSPAPAPAPADDRGWTLVDGVALQAGDQVVTLRTLDRIVSGEIERKRDRIQSQADIDRFTQVLLRQVIVRELESQAGEDMGLAREQIDRIIQSELARNSSQRPSFVDELQRQGLNAFSWSEQQRKELYRYLWTTSVTGASEGFGDKRPTRDEHIRPGELRAIYRENRARLDPAQVELQVLVLSVQAAGSVETARAILEAARQRALSGEDFGALVQEIASERVETRGLTGLMSVDTIADPALRDFAARAKPGDIGELLALPPGGPPQAMLLPRLEQRIENEPPPFGERKVQTFLRATFSDSRRSHLLERERALLLQRAFTWISPGLRPPASSSPPRAP